MLTALILISAGAVKVLVPLAAIAAGAVLGYVYRKWIAAAESAAVLKARAEIVYLQQEIKAAHDVLVLHVKKTEAQVRADVDAVITRLKGLFS